MFVFFINFFEYLYNSIFKQDAEMVNHSTGYTDFWLAGIGLERLLFYNFYGKSRKLKMLSFKKLLLFLFI